MGAVGPQQPGTDLEPEPADVLRAVVELSDDAIFLCDTEGRVTTWGATAERLLGWPSDDVVFRTLDILCPEHLQAEVSSVLAAVLAGDRIEHLELEVHRLDGLPVPVSFSFCPMEGPGGGVTGVVVVARDVTEQRLTQATLAQMEDRLEEGETLAHVGSWMWDLRTGAVQWSAEFHRIHGVDPLDFDGTLESHVGLIHVDDRRSVLMAMDESVASGRPLEARYRIVRPDAAVRTMHVRAQPSCVSAPLKIRQT